MADQPSKEVQAKHRIISHMNADHHDSIIRYLQHHHNFSAYTAYNAKMTDITLSAMTFNCAGAPYQIPFNPPLTSLRETRERVVQMDADALTALRKSPITVTEYAAPPPGLGALPFLVCAATFVCYSQRWWFGAGGPVEAVLGEGFARFSWVLQPWVFWGMVVLHGIEAVIFSQTRLGRHSVNVRTRAYWSWVGSFFVEGVFARMRFDRLVAGKKKELEKRKH